MWLHSYIDQSTQPLWLKPTRKLICLIARRRETCVGRWNIKLPAANGPLAKVSTPNKNDFQWLLTVQKKWHTVISAAWHTDEDKIKALYHQIIEFGLIIRSASTAAHDTPTSLKTLLQISQ
jgi:hypothetical protein